MFWKLWKYELKCSYRSYLFTYAILLLSALFFSTRSSDIIMMIVSLLFTIMLLWFYINICDDYQNLSTIDVHKSRLFDDDAANFK